MGKKKVYSTKEWAFALEWSCTVNHMHNMTGKMFKRENIEIKSCEG